MRLLVSETNWMMATLARQMRDEGFFVSEARDGEDILTHLEQGQYDAVLLNPDLPDESVTRLIRQIKYRDERIPVSVFDGEWTHEDRVRMFAAGADFVAGAPFDAPALSARIRAYARRAHGFATPVLEFCGLSVDVERRLVRFGARSIHLTRLEYELVEMLALNDGRLVDREAIMTKLYAWDNEPDAKIIDVYVCRVRAKLATLGAQSDLISTSFGRGFRINPFAGATPTAPPPPETVEEPPTPKAA